jgi:hypothetical protein
MREYTGGHGDLEEEVRRLEEETKTWRIGLDGEFGAAEQVRQMKAAGEVQGAKVAELEAKLVQMEEAKEQESSGGQEEKEMERELRSLRAAVWETGGKIGEAWRVRNGMEEVLGEMKEGEWMARENGRMAKEKGEEMHRMEERLSGEVEVLRRLVERWRREEMDSRSMLFVVLSCWWGRRAGGDQGKNGGKKKEKRYASPSEMPMLM